MTSPVKSKLPEILADFKALEAQVNTGFVPGRVWGKIEVTEEEVQTRLNKIVRGRKTLPSEREKVTEVATRIQKLVAQKVNERNGVVAPVAEVPAAPVAEAPAAPVAEAPAAPVKTEEKKKSIFSHIKIPSLTSVATGVSVLAGIAVAGVKMAVPYCVSQTVCEAPAPQKHWFIQDAQQLPKCIETNTDTCNLVNRVNSYLVSAGSVIAEHVTAGNVAIAITALAVGYFAYRAAKYVKGQEKAPEVQPVVQTKAGTNFLTGSGIELSM